jgi:hypothetical protein
MAREGAELGRASYGPPGLGRVPLRPTSRPVRWSSGSEASSHACRPTVAANTTDGRGVPHASARRPRDDPSRGQLTACGTHNTDAHDGHGRGAAVDAFDHSIPVTAIRRRSTPRTVPRPRQPLEIAGQESRVAGPRNHRFLQPREPRTDLTSPGAFAFSTRCVPR